MSPHYWISDGGQETDDGTMEVTSWRCKHCKMASHLFLERHPEYWNRWFEYEYPNGDMSLLFDFSMSDPCPEEWDLGSWLPGAKEI